jgi:hypothetical protein
VPNSANNSGSNLLGSILRIWTHIDAFLTASAHNYSDKRAERN